MSLIHKYVALEVELHDLQKQLNDLEKDKRLKTELDFKEKIEEVMRTYDMSAEDVIELFKPYMPQKVYVKPTRKPRKLKVYKHPENGEVIETRGGNHKKLREWKEEYGAEIVESWVLQPEEP